MRYRFLRFPGFKTKAFTASFDDGSVDDIRLVEMFNQYGIKGTFNISSARFSDKPEDFPRALTKEEAMKIFIPNGHEVAVHGLRHISPYQSAPPVMIRELLEDRIGLEKMYDRLIQGLAFPDDGRTSDDLVRRLQDLGFHYCRCLSYDPSFNLPEDWLRLQPTVKFNAPNAIELLDQFLELPILDKYISQRASKWYYFWGHSHELRGQDNWYIIDEMGKRVQNHPDVWLATNGEIYDYVHAYKSLQFSADDSFCYNPTHYTLYLEVDKVNIIIHPGETYHFN